MTISSTRSFNPDFAEIYEDAFEQAGLELRTGNDVITARRSMNLLLLEWANKGINLWTIDSQTIAAASVTAGDYEYEIDIDTVAVLDVAIRTNAGVVNSQVDRQLTEISAATYAQISNKLMRGAPTQFWINRTGIRNVSGSTHQYDKLVLWPVPDQSSYYTIVYYRMKRMADAGTGATATPEAPARFLPALVTGLALKIAKKKPMVPQTKVAELRADYELLLSEAQGEDRERQDLSIVPDMSGYSPLG